MSSAKDFFSAYGGSGSSSRPAGTVLTVGQFLDSYIIHIIITTIFVIGAIMLIDRYAAYATKPFSIWGDLFYSIGAVTIAVNVGFMISIVIAWLTKKASFLAREDDEIHWLHAISLLAAGLVVGWGILAMVLTFGDVIAGGNTDQIEAGGYILVLFSVAYCTYLVIRYIMGLAGKKTVAAAAVQAPTSVDTNAILSALKAGSAANSGGFAQPLFGGGGGSAAFGGIDLSSLQPSSVSTLPPHQAASAQPNCAPGGYPMMMAPMMMMQSQAPACVTDPNVVQF
jgi:hypothetical protein